MVSAHREENIDSAANFSALLDSVNGIAEHYSLPVIFSTHPRTRKKLEQNTGVTVHPLVRFLKPLGLPDYVRLQQEALCVVSDSGTITEESSILGFPAITIRQAHERPEGMDEGVLIMSGLARESVLRAIATVIDQHRPGTRPTRVCRRLSGRQCFPESGAGHSQLHRICQSHRLVQALKPILVLEYFAAD